MDAEKFGEYLDDFLLGNQSERKIPSFNER